MSSKRPKVTGNLPGAKGRRIIDRDERIMVTTTKAGPIVAKRAEGAMIEDVDGNRIIDMFSGIGVSAVGHCHPRVVKAITEQTEKFIHIGGTDFYYENQVELAEKLAALAPGRMKRKVFFANSGTETVEAAMKIARFSSKRNNFIGFMGAFHGRTMGSLALTASKAVQREGFSPFMPGGYHIPYAYCYRCRYKLEYPDCDVWCAKILEEVYFDGLIPPGDVAAMVAEPIQGEGGYIVPPKEFFKILKKAIEKHGILFIDDEVQAGMGRTGRMWAIEHFGVVPDILTASKALGSGLPIGATIVDSRLDFDRSGRHSNTFGGNPVAAAAALAVFDIIKRERLLERAERLGKESKKRLNELQDKYEIIGDTRGLGLMLAQEFVKDKASKVPNREVRDRIISMALKKGLGLIGCGKSAIRYIPPLIIDDELLDISWHILDESIRAAEKEVKWAVGNLHRGRE